MVVYVQTENYCGSPTVTGVYSKATYEKKVKSLIENEKYYIRDEIKRLEDGVRTAEKRAENFLEMSKGNVCINKNLRDSYLNRANRDIDIADNLDCEIAKYKERENWTDDELLQSALNRLDIEFTKVEVL